MQPRRNRGCRAVRFTLEHPKTSQPRVFEFPLLLGIPPWRSSGIWRRRYRNTSAAGPGRGRRFYTLPVFHRQCFGRSCVVIRPRPYYRRPALVPFMIPPQHILRLPAASTASGLTAGAAVVALAALGGLPGLAAAEAPAWVAPTKLVLDPILLYFEVAFVARIILSWYPKVRKAAGACSWCASCHPDVACSSLTRSV